MAVNYSLTQISTKPGQADAPKKWYAKAQANGEVTLDEMIDRVIDIRDVGIDKKFIKQMY